MMIWTAWNNGKHHLTGAGYGLKVSAEDRDRHFNPAWRSVSVELPICYGFIVAEVNVGKESFWGPTCRERISAEIGRWMISNQYAPWKDDLPPKFNAEALGGARFRVNSRRAA